MKGRVVVVGAGVAGVAAALSARRAGYDAQMLSFGVGASSLTSGALDWSSWSLAAAAPVLSPEEHEELTWFWRGLSFDLAARQVVTNTGLVRPAAGSDRWLLDLASLPEGSTVGIVQTNWASDDTPALLRALQSDPRAAGRSFVAVAGDSLFSQAERRLPLAALVDRFSPEVAERLVELATGAGKAGIAALLVGPYLGLDPAAHKVLVSAPIPIKETTSPPDGSAGRRLEQRLSELLTRQGVPITSARVSALRALEHGIEVTFGAIAGTQADDRRVQVDFVILATGGLVGGGLALGTGPGQAVGSPLLDGVADSGSFLGWDPAADGGTWLRPGFGPGGPPELHGGRVLCVGDVKRGAPQTLLAASLDGLRVFRR